MDVDCKVFEVDSWSSSLKAFISLVTSVSVVRFFSPEALDSASL